MHTQYSRVVVALAVIATWVSLWLSTTPLPIDNDQVDAYMHNGGSVPLSGRGGWPLPAFKYPVSPLGGDIPNADAFFPFLLNIGFWLAAVMLLTWFIPRRFFTPSAERVTVGLACVLTVFAIAFLLIKFD